MIRLKKCLIGLFVVLVAFDFVLVPKSEALISNITAWGYEQMGDLNPEDPEKQLEYYKNARDLYEYDNNSEGYERTKRKIGLVLGWDYEKKGDSSSDKNEKKQYYKEAIEAYEYGKCSADKERVQEKINKLKSWLEKIFD